MYGWVDIVEGNVGLNVIGRLFLSDILGKGIVCWDFMYYIVVYFCFGIGDYDFIFFFC